MYNYSPCIRTRESIGRIIAYSKNVGGDPTAVPFLTEDDSYMLDAILGVGPKNKRGVGPAIRQADSSR